MGEQIPSGGEERNTGKAITQDTIPQGSNESGATQRNIPEIPPADTSQDSAFAPGVRSDEIQAKDQTDSSESLGARKISIINKAGAITGQIIAKGYNALRQKSGEIASTRKGRIGIIGAAAITAGGIFYRRRQESQRQYEASIPGKTKRFIGNTTDRIRQIF